MMMSIEDARTRSLLKSRDLQLKLQKLVAQSHLAIKDGEQKYDDLLSHWVLCLAFSQTEELRRRFVQFETDVFNFRFSQLSSAEIKRFVAEEGLGYVQLTEAERDELFVTIGDETFNPLDAVFQANNRVKDKDTSVLPFSRTLFYKVPFTEVCSLVRTRRVHIKAGVAYVSQSDLVSALSSRFSSELTAKLETAARSLAWAAKDDRMGPLITKLQTASIGNDMSNTSVTSKMGSVKLEDVPSLAKRSFPMCGRVLEQAITKEHHLKHMARLQYTLFLKGIGLTMDDCIEYFQREFAKRPTTPEEFRKKGYLYSIKHSYGQEGKRANYTPWSCAKAIANRQTASDHRHGCPFQEFTPEKIGQAVKETGVSESVMREIVDRVKRHDYQIACRLHWEALHPGGNAEPVGNHPNAWFDESMKYYDQKDKEAAGAASQATPSSSQPAVPSSQTATTAADE